MRGTARAALHVDGLICQHVRGSSARKPLEHLVAKAEPVPEQGLVSANLPTRYPVT